MSAILTLLLLQTLPAEPFALAPIFADHMVLPRDVPVAVFGHGPPGTRVSVRFANHPVEGSVGADGRWRVTLPALEARKAPRTLTVVATTTRGSRTFRVANAPRGFTIAGKDRVFHAARAEIRNRAVVVRSPRVEEPIAVRYAWANDPDVNLVDARGLPAAPFRTDDWPLDGAAPMPLDDDAESFESIAAGPLLRAKGAIGTWTAKKGHAEITARFARTGNRALRLFGGEHRRVDVRFPRPLGEPHQLVFHAERWTRRLPFACHLSIRRDGVWIPFWDGTKEVKVGARFLTTVRLDIPAGTTGLRWTCTSPEGSGLLVDDIRLHPAGPMKVTRIETRHLTVPALLGKRDNPVVELLVHTEGSTNAPRGLGLLVSLDGTTHPDDVRAVRVYRAGPRKGWPTDQPLAGVPVEGRRRVRAARPRAFHTSAPLETGINRYWVSIELASHAGLDGGIRAVVETVTVSGRRRRPRSTTARKVLRKGVALRSAGQDGCHTYRIPGLVTTNAGTLLAVYDCRYRSTRDLPGDVDVGLSRSTDGGRTWSRMRVIMDQGRDPKWRHDGIGDPAILVDRKTGKIWVAATWSHGDRSWNGSGPGLTPEETGQFMLVRSDDDGRTWSKPVNITRQVKDPKWRFVLQGPGKGISLRDGTLVFPAQYRAADGEPHGGKPFSTLIASRDHGRTWTIGTGVKIDTTESQVVELADGRLMINCRDNRGGSRSVYTTRDLGGTWQVHPTSRKALPEPVCQASLIRFEHAEHGPLLVFSNPASTAGRRDMTLKVSRDEGMTWPEELHTLFDERTGFGYSCLTRIDEDHVGVLYEGVRELYFVRFHVDELLGR